MKTENFKKHLQLLALLLGLAISGAAQTTAFNYQGKLTDGGAAANGAFQMQFKLFDSLNGGSQIGATLSDVPVTAENGVFAVKLDFGASAFSGANRFLEIAVRRNAGESYVTLAPREQIASSPYAVRTLSAAVADNALNLGGVPASEFVRNSDVDSSFIRNSTTPQTANFNISGNALVGGLVGLGTPANGNFRLDSLGGIRAFSNASAHVVAETTGGTNTWARFYMRSPSRSWFMGTSQNFNGNQFYLADETAGQTRMAISTDGLVGFGTTNPQSGLELRGTGAQTQQRITDNTSGNSLVLQSGAGANMKITGFNYGSGTAVPLYLSVDGANTILNSGGGNVGIGTATPNAKLTVIGNTTQDSNSYGMPKAMLFVLADGTISRCYNGTTGATTGGCGFTITRNGGTVYIVTFDFSMSGRFVSYVPVGDALAKAGHITSVGSNSVSVKASFIDQARNEGVASDFYMIVY